MEDQYFWPEAEASFTFVTTFRQLDDEGKKINITGSTNAFETQYKLVYLVKWQSYLKKLQALQKLVMA